MADVVPRKSLHDVWCLDLFAVPGAVHIQLQTVGEDSRAAGQWCNLTSGMVYIPAKIVRGLLLAEVLVDPNVKTAKFSVICNQYKRKWPL